MPGSPGSSPFLGAGADCLLVTIVIIANFKHCVALLSVKFVHVFGSFPHIVLLTPVLCFCSAVSLPDDFFNEFLVANRKNMLENQ